jgi:hypothetical protein
MFFDIRNEHKNLEKKIFFVGFLKVTDEKAVSRAGSASESVSKR